MSGKECNISVVVRIRPFDSRRANRNECPIVQVLDNKSLIFDPIDHRKSKLAPARAHKNLKLTFDRIYNTNDETEQILEECTANMVDNVIKGYNCSVFAYGATGTGKTYTMLGNQANPGLIYMTMSDLITKLDARKNDFPLDVVVICLEVINEQVLDLLNKDKPLKLHDRSDGVIITGLIPTRITNTKDLKKILAKFTANRIHLPTDQNAESSRSHAIFQAQIRMVERKRDVIRKAKLSMIDLAGSERANTRVITGKDANSKVDPSINRALLALGNCLSKLADGDKHIPYRDSNLTRLLRDSLGGNCQTLMVANVSTSQQAYENTYTTIMYAARTKSVCINPRQNIVKMAPPKPSQSAVNKKSSPIKQSGQSSTESSFDGTADLGAWFKHINEVYDTAIHSQQIAASMQNRNRILNLRINLKQKTDACNKMLAKQNNDSNEADFASFATSISHLATQIERENNDLKRIGTSMQQAFQRLEELKQKIDTSDHATALKIHLQSKEVELNDSRKNVGGDGVAETNKILKQESQQLHQHLTMACEILQKYYDALNAKQTLSPSIQTNYQELQRVLRSKNDSFRDEFFTKVCK